MNYYPHHIGDYLRDTSHLSLLEHGAYRRMLDLYYASEKPLPLDPVWVCRLVRADNETERAAVQFILTHFFEECVEGWRNKRADAEIKSAGKRTKAARTNGKKGGRPKTQRVNGGLAKANPYITQGKAPNNQKPITNNQKPNTSTTAGKPDKTDGFEEFWNTYPQRAGNNPKHRALKAYAVRIAEGHAPAEFLEGVGRYAAFVRATGKEGTEFVLQAATFLGPDKPFLMPWTGANGAGVPDYSDVIARIKD